MKKVFLIIILLCVVLILPSCKEEYRGDFIVVEENGEIIEGKDAMDAFYEQTKNGEKLRLKSEEIIFIESFGHSVVIHSTDGECYYALDRLYQLTSILDNTKFIRVSNCAIIARLHVKRIKPSISMKFILTMSDGSLVDVTRSYYSSFKDFFGI